MGFGKIGLALGARLPRGVAVFASDTDLALGARSPHDVAVCAGVRGLTAGLGLAAFSLASPSSSESGCSRGLAKSRKRSDKRNRAIVGDDVDGDLGQNSFAFKGDILSIRSTNSAILEMCSRLSPRWSYNLS